MKDFRPRLIIIVFIGIILIGTVGYWSIEPAYSLFDSFYMTVITLGTIGFREIHDLSTAGRLFTIILFSLWVVGGALTARMIGQMLFEGQLGKILGRRRMDKKIGSLTNHYIVAGYGRIGRVVCDEFARHKESFVVIEQNDSLIEEIKSKNYLYIHGDCTIDSNLTAAGIEKAKGFINSIANDADAVYVTLSARQQNPNIFIMARADSIASEQKLKRAGASRVISPQISAGLRMAMGVMRPNVVDFMTIASYGGHEGLRIEEVVVASNSRLIGKSFKEIDIRAKYGLNVIGVKKGDGGLIYNPPADHVVSNGDTLIMVGGGDQLSKIAELFAPFESSN